MNRKNELEIHLLSRSYSEDHNKLVQLLQSRYSANGDQKASLILEPTQGDSKPETVKSLLHIEAKPHPAELRQSKRKQNTRMGLKRYIATATRNQTTMVRKLHTFMTKSARKETLVAARALQLVKQYDIPQFADFLPLHNLWIGYVQTLLQLANPHAVRNPQSLLPKLSSADYNGAYLAVTQSANPNNVGMAGIVIYDAQHSFVLVVPSGDSWKRDVGGSEGASVAPLSAREWVGGLRIIEKKNTIFSFAVPVVDDSEEADTVEFNLIGSRVEFRSVDRSAKKFKGKNVDDLV